MGVWFDIKRWEPIHTTLIREAVNATAQANAINVAKTWAESLVWDGMDRYADALKHMCVEANDYTMAVMHYWWSAHGARILCPGYKCDSIIVLVGEQSTGKTMLIDTLAPKIGELRTYRDCNIEQLLHDDKSARIVRGALVLNLDELRYFSRREQAEIKATLSRTHESFVPKYIEFRNEFGRMCIIYATTNNYEFLDDETGNRRYHALVVRGEINLEWFRTHGEQLWAQGVHEFKTSGLSWQNAARFAPNQLIEHEMSDVWEDVIIDYLETIVTENVTTSEILELACKMPINQQDRKSQMRVAKILISIGWEKKIIWRNNSTTRVWQRKLNQW
jgi:predicted P-loop ATPase